MVDHSPPCSVVLMLYSVDCRSPCTRQTSGPSLWAVEQLAALQLLCINGCVFNVHDLSDLQRTAKLAGSKVAAAEGIRVFETRPLAVFRSVSAPFSGSA